MRLVQEGEGPAEQELVDEKLLVIEVRLVDGEQDGFRSYGPIEAKEETCLVEASGGEQILGENFGAEEDGGSQIDRFLPETVPFESIRLDEEDPRLGSGVVAAGDEDPFGGFDGGRLIRGLCCYLCGGGLGLGNADGIAVVMAASGDNRRDAE
ncbi:MAG TPA: hypothetical protein QGF05_03185 [Dehalococcoidia bacterium]|nr:hypothetical protein [Dehalococcoidia bacterium]